MARTVSAIRAYGRGTPLLLALLIACPVSAQQLEDGAPVPAGDPTLFFAEGYYYVFSSGRGLPFYRSRDLVTWRSCGRVFAKLPRWADAAVPKNRGFVWAPDAVKIGSEYRVYWSTSTLGSRRSVIGFASNRTLAPDSPAYGWVDRGKVIATTPRDDWNAIDPQCFVDRQGKVWLAMGSYWSGIKMRRLDRKTGRLSRQDTTLYRLARRTDVEPPAIEGAYLFWRNGFYYLFVSFDRCHLGVRSNYNVRVGRSRDVVGPYRDRLGQPMLESGGTVILKSKGNVRGPGHNSVLQHDGQTWIAFHYFNPARRGQRTLQVRRVSWDEQGWPRVGERTAGRQEPRSDTSTAPREARGSQLK